MKVARFNIEEMVIDLYYWFDKSTKRKASLAEYCTFCDTNYSEIVKHASTRWLSLERAISRVLQQYAALKSYCLYTSMHALMHALMQTSNLDHVYFCIDDDAPRFQRLHALFLKPMTEVHLLFYQSVLQIFISTCFFKEKIP